MATWLIDSRQKAKGGLRKYFVHINYNRFEELDRSHSQIIVCEFPVNCHITSLKVMDLNGYEFQKLIRVLPKHDQQ